MSKVLGVIPARIGSTRLPEKPLVMIHGKPLIQWVVENAHQMKLFDELIVATDSLKILNTVQGFGAQVQLTSPDHATGTDRVCEVALQRDFSIIVNLQGDEPFVKKQDLGKALDFFKSNKFRLVTLSAPLKPEDWLRPEVVKVAYDSQTGQAIDFFRLKPESVQPQKKDTERVGHHVGVYLFSRACLEAWEGLPPSERSQDERLEQLKALDAGVSIGVVSIENESIGIDTSEDVERAAHFLVKP